MNPYTYTISFRLKHPTASLRDEYRVLSALSGIVPGRLMSAGEPRTDPTGAKIGGVYQYSHCSFSFSKKWKNSSDERLPDALGKAIDKLCPHKSLLDQIRKSDGLLDFFIGLGIDANAGITLDVELLKKLAALEIELGFDIYPPDNNK